MTPIEKAAQRPVDILIPYLGYGEKDSNSGLDRMDTYGHNNYTFIARDIDALRDQGILFYNGRKQGAEWCDMTNDWAHIKAWGAQMAMKVLYQPAESCGAGCYWSAKYFRDNGAWIDRGGTPRTGDQIFFGSKYDESHTGIVEKVDSAYVYTIEGNTSDKLMRKTYARNNSRIAGYGRPRYELVAYLFEEEPEMTAEEAKKLIADSVKDAVAAAVKTINTDIDNKIETALSNVPAPTRDTLMASMNDRWIEKFTDLPDWAKKEIRELIEMGALKGTKPAATVEDTTLAGSLNNLIRPTIIAFRAVKQALGDAPKEVLVDMLKRVLAGICEDNG